MLHISTQIVLYLVPTLSHGINLTWILNSNSNGMVDRQENIRFLFVLNNQVKTQTSMNEM